MPIHEPAIYQLKGVLLGISPMIWRRLLIHGDNAITDLHYILQIAMGWLDDHLFQFRIHGKCYGIARIGGISFSDDHDSVRLKDLGLRINEHFVYEYDFTDDWQHQIRVEAILAPEPHQRYPVCIDGRRACPTLDEAKDLLESVQRTLVEQQVAEYLEQQAYCPGCGKKRLRKGNHHPLVYRTLFGKLRLRSVRLYHCDCQPHATRTFSPLAQLLTERTAPELLYLETKFASLMSYGLTVKLLQEVLPIGHAINAATVRNKVHAVGQRIDQELCEERVFFIDGCEHDWEQLPRPDMPLTVGIDGGYVHSCAQRSRKEGWFEVIAGKSVTAEGASKRFAFVNNYDDKPRW